MHNVIVICRPLVIFLLSIVVTLPLLAQDATPTAVDIKDIPNFGQVIMKIDVPMDNRDFLLAKYVAVQPDLSRIYVASGASGIVYIFDDKGQLLDEVDTVYEVPITDMIVGSDGNLYIAQLGNIDVYDRDGQRIRQILGVFSDGVIYSQVIPLPDKTLLAAQLFGDKDRLYHLDTDGTLIEESEPGYFSILNGYEFSQFDRVVLGQDGYLYYFSHEAKVMYQIDEDWELLAQYSGLIESPQGDPARTGVLVDANSRVLLGDFGGVQIFGDKEQLIYTIKLAEQYGFVHHMVFADNGLLITVQPNTVSIIQYGLRGDN